MAVLVLEEVMQVLDAMEVMVANIRLPVANRH